MLQPQLVTFTVRDLSEQSAYSVGDEQLTGYKKIALRRDYRTLMLYLRIGVAAAIP